MITMIIFTLVIAHLEVGITVGGVARPLVGLMTTSYEPRLAKPIAKQQRAIATTGMINPLLQ